MTEEDALIQTVLDHPFDDTSRLVYADWLEERGDLRGELLRLQMKLAQLPVNSQQYFDLWQREKELWPDVDQIWWSRLRRFTTPQPCRDIAKLVPDLAPFACKTLRLHPQRTPWPLPYDASKIGGPFLWPAEEPWPMCPDCKIPMVAVIQLRKHDVPNVEFYKGTDLFQLLWCPRESNHDYYPLPVVRWRRASDVQTQLYKVPQLADFGVPETDLEISELVPRTCTIHPEWIVEYPEIDDLRSEVGNERANSIYQMIESLVLEHDAELQQRVLDHPRDFEYDAHRVNPGTLYCYELSRCEGTKVGGGGNFPNEGRNFEHFLTLSSWEFHIGSFRRWLAHESQRRLTEPGQLLTWNQIARSSELFDALREPTAMQLGRTQRLYLYFYRDSDPWQLHISIHN